MCSCSKLLLIVINFWCCLGGIFLSLLGWTVSPYSVLVTYILIGSGSITSVVSLLGLSGAAMELSLLLLLYGLSVFLTMLASVAGGILVWQFQFTEPINKYLQQIVRDFVENYNNDSISENGFLGVIMDYIVQMLMKVEEGWLIKNRILVTGVAGAVLLLQMMLIILMNNVKKKIGYHSASAITTISRQGATNPAYSPSAPHLASTSENADNPVFYADFNGLDFDCKVCMKPMTPPKKIFQCKDGHALCESCSSNPSVTSCPFCRRPLDGGRNLALEELAQQYFQKIPRQEQSPSLPPRLLSSHHPIITITPPPYSQCNPEERSHSFILFN